MAGAMPMPPAEISFEGFISCQGTGGNFCLITPAGMRVDLLAPEAVFEPLNMRVDQMVLTRVTGTLLSSPDAPRPRLLVTSVSGPAPAPPTPLPPTPPLPTAPPMTTAIELPSSIRIYLDCVARCFGEKVPGAAAAEIINSVCANTLLAAGQLQPVVGAMAVADLPGWVIALAGCVAFAGGFGLGEVLECFLACAPGGRLNRGEEVFEIRQNGGAGSSIPAQTSDLQQRAIAFSQAMAARGVQISPAQVLQLMIRHQLSQNAAQRGGRL